MWKDVKKSRARFRLVRKLAMHLLFVVLIAYASIVPVGSDFVPEPEPEKEHLSVAAPTSEIAAGETEAPPTIVLHTLQATPEPEFGLEPEPVPDFFEPTDPLVESDGMYYECTSYEAYLLAKIAMAEAECCSLRTKTLVIYSVLNRVASDNFPNDIESVLVQRVGDTYQYSPMGNGRWASVEPNDECWEAVQAVLESSSDQAQGAMYFESCANEDNWHSRNLEFLFESDGVRFYK